MFLNRFKSNRPRITILNTIFTFKKDGINEPRLTFLLENLMDRKMSGNDTILRFLYVTAFWYLNPSNFILPDVLEAVGKAEDTF